MRKNKRIVALLLALLLAVLCGCDVSTTPSSSANTQIITTTPSSTTDYILNSLPNMVQIEGKLFYLDVPLESGVAIQDWQITGYITASHYEIPDADGECNFAPVGAPYAPWSTAEYPETYVIYVTIANHTGWYLLRPAEG